MRKRHASPVKSRPGTEAKNRRRWVRNVKTVSTFPPKGTFTKDAETIARVMTKKEVSPKGVGSGIRMIQFFINRAGKHLSPERRKELQKAIRILQQKRRGRRPRITRG